MIPADEEDEDRVPRPASTAKGTHADKRRATLQRIGELHLESESATESPTPPDERGWGVPDWHDEAGYPKPSELDRFQWRWEFLRRNHGYRSDWLWPAGKFDSCPRDLYFQEAYGLDPWLDPRIGIREMRTLAEARRPDTAEGHIFPPSREPHIPFLEARLANNYALADEFSRLGAEEAAPDTLFLKLHLSRPLTPQLKELTRIAFGMQRSRFGRIINSGRLWPQYLRVLDACDAGASYGEVAATILRTKPDNLSLSQIGRDIVKAAESHRTRWRR